MENNKPKKINWNSAFKIAGIILVIVLIFLYFENRSQQRYEKRDEQLSRLQTVSQQLEELHYYCQDARKNEDHEDLIISMYHAEEKCNELKHQVDIVIDYLTPEEPDYDESSRRSWFY